MLWVVARGDHPETEFVMGARSKGFRKEIRGGIAHWIIDFRYRNKQGRTERCRRDARVQTVAGARSEAERLMLYALDRGSLEPERTAPTFEAFVRG
jgi:hypothetical protein